MLVRAVGERRVDLQEKTNVSEEPAVSIFRAAVAPNDDAHQ